MNSTEKSGGVGDDGKLDYVDINDSQSLKQSSPGSGILVAASSVTGTFERHTRVNMRTGQYEADPTYGRRHLEAADRG